MFLVACIAALSGHTENLCKSLRTEPDSKLRQSKCLRRTHRLVLFPLALYDGDGQDLINAYREQGAVLKFALCASSYLIQTESAPQRGKIIYPIFQRRKLRLGEK